MHRITIKIQSNSTKTIQNIENYIQIQQKICLKPYKTIQNASKSYQSCQKQTKSTESILKTHTHTHTHSHKQIRRHTDTETHKQIHKRTDRQTKTQVHIQGSKRT